uniref:RING-type domain-containing protein n=1 Tax=Aegilops tauschii subsp. strangulata TaxID=200361 RepID=A0A453PPI5_AEGTS
MGDSSVAPAGALVPSVPKPEHAPSAGDAAVQLQALAAAAADDECAGASPSSSPGEGEGAGAAAEGADAAGDRDLLCPICMALIKDAFLTACGHSFCYMCIVTHLNHKSDCPCCANYLTKAQLYPNFLLDKVVKKMSARQVAKTASPIDQFRHVVQQGNDMTVKELDSLMTLIAEKKRQMEQQESETNMQILLVFLHCLRKQKLEELNEIQTDLQYIKDDISSVERHRLDLYRTKERYSMRLRMLLDEPAASKMWPSPMDKPNSAFVPNSRAPPSTSSPGGLNNRRFDLRAPASHQGHQRRDALASSDPPNPPIQSGNVIARKRRVQAQFNELQEYYLQRRRTGAQSHRQEDVVAMNREGYHEGLEDFQSVLTTFTRYSRLRVIAELRHGDLFHSANIVSSIEFDRDDELFATAGVSKRIKVFEFSTVVNEPSDVHCPVVEMATRSKLSCLSWNKYSKNVIASSDYEGIVTVWDVQTRQSVMEYEEHEKRAWSVDFSRTEPKMLVSGSDDCKVETSECCISALQFYSDFVITDRNLLLCMPGQSVVHKSGSECH